MSITMTIEVTPEQAMRIAEILGNDTAKQTQSVIHSPTPVSTLPTAPAPQQSPIVQPPVQAPPIIPSSVQNIAPSPTQQIPPVAPRTYTQDELALASRPICEMGRQKELLDLLHSFTCTDASGNVRNVQSIRELPEECYPAFANGIRTLGGKI